MMAEEEETRITKIRKLLEEYEEADVARAALKAHQPDTETAVNVSLFVSDGNNGNAIADEIATVPVPILDASAIILAVQARLRDELAALGVKV